MSSYTFANSRPIADLYEALALLVERPGTRTLECFPDDDVPHIHIVHTSDRNGRVTRTSEKRYSITYELFETLKQCAYVETLDSSYELGPNLRGVNEYYELHERRVEEARRKLIPGTHGWSSLYTYVGTKMYQKEGSSHAEQTGFLFRTPVDDEFLVFADGVVIALPRT